MTAYFELRHNLANQSPYSFVLKAGNHEIILVSEHYTTKAAAENGIASVQTNGPDANRYETRTANNGQAYFVLKAANHQIIGTSETYSSEQACQKGMASVQANSSTTLIQSITL
jgi:uncharacterized protein YegP (UPF0339 family)